jgi:hypothetical protein
MSQTIRKMMKAVRKYLKLIVKLPNGKYIDSSNAYTEILFALDLPVNCRDFTLYLSQCCNISEYCFSKHWISEEQYNSIYEEVNLVSYLYYHDSEEEDYYADVYDDY